MKAKIALGLVAFIIEVAMEIGLTHAEMRGVHKLCSHICEMGALDHWLFGKLGKYMSAEKSQLIDDMDNIPF